MARKGRTKPILRPADEPMTPERRRHAGPDGIATGDDGMGGKRHTFLSPLGRLFARDGIDVKAYNALQKFRVHYHNAGLNPGVGSVDLNRIFASDPSNFSGMAKTERQAFHRQQYRNAVQLLGLIAARVVEYVVCAEFTLEQAGAAVFELNSPFRAREEAAKRLRESGAVLAKLWGM
jgi:hypothetical protein